MSANVLKPDTCNIWGGVHTDYCGQLWQKDMFDFRGLQFAEIYGAMCNVNMTVLFMCLISPDKHSTVCSL